MAELTRRGFLKLMGAAVTLSAGGIALLEREPIRTYFLPPVGGWATSLTPTRQDWLIAWGDMTIEGMFDRQAVASEFVRALGVPLNCLKPREWFTLEAAHG